MTGPRLGPLAPRWELLGPGVAGAQLRREKVTQSALQRAWTCPVCP